MIQSSFFYLPMPPSANKIWRAVNGRVIKSAEYRKWIKEAAVAIRTNENYRQFKGDCHVGIDVPRIRSNMDLDNRIKPALDALQAAGVIENDSSVTRIVADFVGKDQPFEVSVTGETNEYKNL